MKTAQSICEEIRGELASTDPSIDSADEGEIGRWASQTLDWNDPSRRYSTCVRKGFLNEALRLDYFRKLLRAAQPAFVHYAIALLMSRGYVRRLCLTTNFDSLLENAFTRLGIAECLSIRSDRELEYVLDRPDRAHVIKLHGDVSSLNILNTNDETFRIGEAISTAVQQFLMDSGLVVLGSAGNEKSIHTLFDRLEERARTDKLLLSYGVLWGVYMGPAKAPDMSDVELNRRVAERIKETGISRDIQEMMGRSSNALFCFFPVWGSGQFLMDLVNATRDPDLSGAALHHMDHEMRLAHVFSNAGLSRESVTKHLAALREQRRRLTSIPIWRQEPETVLIARTPNAPLELRVTYGDITDQRLIDANEFASRRRAVVSAEDRFITAGGGVAYSILSQAGPELLLNELAKFAPVEHRTVVVTSAGKLPVHYVIHAAALAIVEGNDGPDYRVSRDDVQATMIAVLETCRSLAVGAVWVPLIGTGVALLEPSESLRGLLGAIVEWISRDKRNLDQPLTITIVIYREGQLPRNEVSAVLQNTPENPFELDTDRDKGKPGQL